MDKILFVKYSNDRANQFAICTEIFANGDKKLLKKRATTESAREHIKNIASYYAPLKRQFEGALNVAGCQKEYDEINFEMVEGNGLDKIIDSYFEKNEMDKVFQIISEFAQKIYGLKDKDVFTITPSFEKVFGMVHFEETQYALKITDIDMLFDNIIVKDNNWTVIDYEWSFQFPIPVKFVVYRTLAYWYAHLENRRNMEQDFLMEMVGITPQEQIQFAKMEKKFQQYIMDDNIPLRDMPKMMNHKTVDLNHILSAVELEETMQVFYGKDRNFKEENSYFKKVQELEDGNLKVKVEIPEGMQQLRLDPVEEPCIISIEHIYNAQGEEKEKIETNGVELSNKIFFFETSDPQILLQAREEDGCLNIVYRKINLNAFSKDIVHNIDFIIRNEREKNRLGQAALQLEVEERKNKETLLKNQIEINNELSKNNENLKLEKENLNSQIEQYKEMYEAIINSRSWKITKPIRDMADKMKRVKKK